MQDTDDEDGFSGVQPPETVGPGGLPVPQAARLPGQPEDAVDGDGQAALDAAMAVAVDVFAEDTGDDANAGDDEGEADEALKIGVTEPSSKQKRRDWRGGDRGIMELETIAWPRSSIAAGP